MEQQINKLISAYNSLQTAGNGGGVLLPKEEEGAHRIQNMRGGTNGRVPGRPHKESPWEGRGGTVPGIGIRRGGRPNGLYGLLPQDPTYPGMPSTGMPKKSTKCNTDEGSLWTASLGVAGDNTGGGIGTTPIVRELRYVYTLPVGVHNPPTHS